MKATKLIRIALLLILTIGAMAGVGYLYRTGPQASEPVWNEKATVTPTVPLSVSFDAREFDVSVMQHSVLLWNDIMPDEQPLFYIGYEITAKVEIISANGEVCDRMPWEQGPEEERDKDHSARSYQCKDGTWQIHVFAPGDIHTQFCIIAHELGHILGLADDKSGSRIMNQHFCPALVLVSDKDRKAVVKRYRRE